MPQMICFIKKNAQWVTWIDTTWSIYYAKIWGDQNNIAFFPPWRLDNGSDIQENVGPIHYHDVYSFMQYSFVRN